MRLLISLLGILTKSVKNNVCLPGSSECINNVMKMCDLNGFWVYVDCPNGTQCSIEDRRISCILKSDENNIRKFKDGYTPIDNVNENSSNEEQDDKGDHRSGDDRLDNKSGDNDPNDDDDQKSSAEGNSLDENRELSNKSNNKKKSQNGMKNVKPHKNSKDQSDKLNKSQEDKPSPNTNIRNRSRIVTVIGNQKQKTVTVFRNKQTHSQPRAMTVYKGRDEFNKKQARGQDKDLQTDNKNQGSAQESDQESNGNAHNTNEKNGGLKESGEQIFKSIAELLQKNMVQTVISTITQKTAPNEIKLEYTAPNQVTPTVSNFKGGENSSGQSSDYRPNQAGKSSSSSGQPSGTSVSPDGSSGPSSGTKSSGGSVPSSGTKSSSSSTPQSSGSGQPGSTSAPADKSSPSGSGTSTSPSEAKPSSSTSKPSESSGGDKKEPEKSSDSSGGGGMVTEEVLTKVMTEQGFAPKPEFIAAAVKQTNEKVKDKAMAAQLLAQLGHESGGFQYIEEIACAGNKCAGQYGSDQGAPGKQYYGRGFIQLSWPVNYEGASQDLFQNKSLWENPDSVAKDPNLGMQVSIWFWEKNVMGKEGVGPDHFGYTTKAINGELECKNNGNIEKSKKRYEIYKALAKEMKLEKVADEKGCYTL